VNPVLKYTLGRLAILVACVVPALFLLTAVDVLVRLMIALVVSAGISYFALRRWRDEVSERIATNARRRADDRMRLRSALAGEKSTDPQGDARSGDGTDEG
jgi:hypothetical protein